jgi:DNA polymerase IV
VNTSFPLRYLFLDLNAYFASCEQAENPAFRGKPLIVRPSSSEYTSAVAVSYEAKALGIKNGMKIHEARQLCPKLIVRDARHELYVDYHHKIIQAVENILPIDKVYSVDEMAFRLIGEEQEPLKATLLASAMKARITFISPALRCSIGIAPSLLLAKLATDMMKPNGLVILEQKDLPIKIQHLPLREISGISTSMEKRLFEANVKTMLDFWQITPNHARRIWHSVVGERLWYGLHGHDIRPNETKRRMFGHSRVLSGNLTTLPQARLVMRELILKAALRLRREGMTAQILVVSVKLASKNRYGHEARLAPTQESFILLQEAERFWHSIMPLLRGERLLAVSIFLTHLAPLEERVGDLFALEGNTTSGTTTKQENLWQALDKLNHKHGKGTVHLASQRKLNLAYLGAKIAFNRVPTQNEFNE